MARLMMTEQGRVRVLDASTHTTVLPSVVLEALLSQINRAADKHVADRGRDNRWVVRTTRDGEMYKYPGRNTVQERLLLTSETQVPSQRDAFGDLPNVYRIVGWNDGRFTLTRAGHFGSLWSDLQVTTTCDFSGAVVPWPARVRLALNPDELLIPGAVQAACEFVKENGQMPQNANLLLDNWKLKIDVDVSALLPSVDPNTLLPLGSIVTASEAYECGYCGEFGHNMKRCSACKIIRYCSKECQKKDWREHKTECTHRG